MVIFIWKCSFVCSTFVLFFIYSFIKHKTMNNQANVVNAPQTKETRQVINLAKEGETSTQFNLRMKREKRKATNEAGKNLVKAIKGELISLPIIRKIFKSGLIESKEFCASLSKEIGRKITVNDVYKLPTRSYMDFVNETEAARGMIRGGITPGEFKDIILRYYRGEKPMYANLVDTDIKDVLETVYRNK